MKTLIKNAILVNEGQLIKNDVLIEDELILQISSPGSITHADRIIEAEGQYLFPGCIDDQVHFREPGLTHKGEIYTEAKSAVAGGVTSYMEMPNTVPNTFTKQLLEEKN
jgi:dihydroorotase